MMFLFYRFSFVNIDGIYNNELIKLLTGSFEIYTGKMKKEIIMPSFAIVIPAYRANNTIQDVIEKIPNWIDHIIVVDDCSPDNTYDVVQSIANPKIKLLKHYMNRGVGGAMKTGYQKALDLQADIIIKMDSDGQMDPQFLDRLISPIIKRKADYSKGNRFLRGRELQRMPAIRRIGNLGLSFLTKLASGYWNVFDPTNGYTAITKSALSMFDFDHLAERYFFESSMLLELCLHRIVVKDVSIPAIYEDEKSSLSPGKSLLEFPPKLFRGFVRRIFIQYFLVDFSAVSLLLIFGIFTFLFGVIWGIIHWVRSSHLNVVASTGTVMLAVLPIILGVQFLLQALILDTQNTPKEVIEDQD